MVLIGERQNYVCSGFSCKTCPTFTNFVKGIQMVMIIQIKVENTENGTQCVKMYFQQPVQQGTD